MTKKRVGLTCRKHQCAGLYAYIREYSATSWIPVIGWVDYDKHIELLPEQGAPFVVPADVFESDWCEPCDLGWR